MIDIENTRICRYSVYAYRYKCIQQIEIYTEKDNEQTTKTTKRTKTTKTTKTTKSKMAQKNAEQFSFETKEGEAQIGKYIYLYIHINLNGKSYSTNKPNIILHILTSILTLTLASTIVYGDMSVEAVKLPPHLKKRLDASKQRFKKTPLKERMERAEKKRQENLENIQTNARKAIEFANNAARAFGEKVQENSKEEE